MSDDDDNDGSPWWVVVIKTIGLPTAMLCAMTYFVYSAGLWAGEKIVIPLFNKQMTFIDEASDLTRQMSTTTAEINNTLRAHGEHAIESLRLCNNIHQTVADTNATSKMTTERIKANNTEVLNVLQNIEKNTAHLRRRENGDME